MSSTSSQWFRKRIDSYSDELSKSFTEAKARVQRGLEQLKLKNAETFKRIPSFRGSFRGPAKKESKKTKSPRKAKSPKKILQPNSPQPSERSRTFTANSSELNSTYRISRKTYNSPSTFIDQSSGSELEETNITAERTLLSSTRKLPLNTSHSFPRVSRSRKIENINIVFDTPFPPPMQESSPTPHRKQNQTSTPKEQRMPFETCHQDNLGVMHKDTFDMENLRSVVARIHAKQNNVNSVRKPPRVRRCRKDASLLKSPVGSLERHTSDEEVSCSDSELAMSTDISLKSYDSGDDEPRISPPLPIVRADSELDDADVYWIPKKIINLPRTSSRLSMQSRSSYGGSVGGASPGLSPIKNRENRQAERESQLKKIWGMTYKLKKDKDVAKKLFSIDEVPVVDSGYSDRSGATSRATSSRATMYELQNNRWRVTPSPTTSSSPSPTPPIAVPAKIDENLVADSKRFPPSGPYVLKSFYV